MSKLAIIVPGVATARNRQRKSGKKKGRLTLMPRLLVLKRCADCIWYEGDHYEAIGHIPEEYDGKCTYPKTIYQFRIDGTTKFYDGFPAGCPLEEG
jgi:hypothetical protein